MQYQDYSDREEESRRYKAHQGGNQGSKGKRRNNESKGQTNVNFEQGGRLDDEA